MIFQKVFNTGLFTWLIHLSLVPPVKANKTSGIVCERQETSCSRTSLRPSSCKHSHSDTHHTLSHTPQLSHTFTHTLTHHMCAHESPNISNVQAYAHRGTDAQSFSDKYTHICTITTQAPSRLVAYLTLSYLPRPLFLPRILAEISF